ncbi:uncharacterized protein LOC101448665 [Ceratitis capitata]|uniref:uncharacterized protein LOC101448665 n=1 Tax=Ceratitis capitata TaxID=7213 RepID=UPI00032A2D7A|nr:uncharacterized protein LOC101448665 [Ceratitis capitata]
MEFNDVDTSNPGKGNDLRVQISKYFHFLDDCHLRLGCYLAGNTDNRPASFGVFGKCEVPDIGLSASMQTACILGACKLTTFCGEKTLYTKNKHVISGHYRLSEIRGKSVFNYDGLGLGFSYKYTEDYSIKVIATFYSDFIPSAIDVAAKMNLFRTEDNRSSLDFTVSAARYVRGQYAGLNSFSAGIGFIQHL